MESKIFIKMLFMHKLMLLFWVELQPYDPIIYRKPQQLKDGGESFIKILLHIKCSLKSDERFYS
jgi:hypothetical protein